MNIYKLLLALPSNEEGARIPLYHLLQEYPILHDLYEAYWPDTQRYYTPIPIEEFLVYATWNIITDYDDWYSTGKQGDEPYPSILWHKLDEIAMKHFDLLD